MQKYVRFPALLNNKVEGLRISSFLPAILTAAIFVYLFFDLWDKNQREFSKNDLVHLGSFLFAILLIQLTVLSLIKILTSRNNLFSKLFIFTNALIYSLNLFLINLLLLERIVTAPILIILLLFAVFFTIYYFITSRAPALLLLLLIFLPAAATVLTALKEREMFIASALPKTLVYPEFKDRRNVYFISFDALISGEIARKFLQVEDLRYEDVIRRMGGKIFNNAFIRYVPTRPALNSILAIDHQWWRELGGSKYELVLGRQQSPVYKIFRDNAYKIQFMYESEYLGRAGDEEIDFYGTNGKSICEFIDSSVIFWGACTSSMQRVYSNLFGFFERSDPLELLIRRIRLTANDNASWFTMAYVYMPHHTSTTSYSPYNPADLDRYREKFLIGAEVAANWMRQIIETVQVQDPDSILVIFGDHGAWMTRGLDYNNPSDDSPYSAEMIFQDRHAILASVFDRTGCVTVDRSPVLMQDIIRKVVSCLSGGEDPYPDAPPPGELFLRYGYE